jgi:hypothetical protein
MRPTTEFCRRERLVREAVRQGGIDAELDRVAAANRIQRALGISDRQLARATVDECRRWGCAYSTAVDFRERRL